MIDVEAEYTQSTIFTVIYPPVKVFNFLPPSFPVTTIGRGALSVPISVHVYTIVAENGIANQFLGVSG